MQSTASLSLGRVTGMRSNVGSWQFAELELINQFCIDLTSLVSKSK